MTLAGFLLLFAPHLVLSQPGLAVTRGWLRAAYTLGSILCVTFATTSMLGQDGRPGGTAAGGLTRSADAC